MTDPRRDYFQDPNVRNEGGTGGVPAAYQTPSGQPKAVRGDQFFPFVKDPSDLAGMHIYRAEADLPNVAVVADYDIGPEIETAGFRQLEVVIVYTPAQDGQQAPVGFLSLILQKLRTPEGSDQELWAAQGVLDPTLQVPPTGDPLPIEDGYAARRAYLSELVVEPYNGQAATQTGPFILTLTFDVQTARKVRLLAGSRDSDDTPTAARLALYAELQR